MGKEHWATRLKRENTELKAEVKVLRAQGGKSKDFSGLRRDIQANVKEYSAQEVMDFAYSLEEIATAKHPYGGQAFQISDSKFFIPTEDMFERILAETEVDTIEWVAEKNDCEDISKYFSALVSVKLGINCVGVVRSVDGGHAFGFAFVRDQRDNLKAIWFEPQTDKILTPSEIGKGMYQMGPGRASFMLG